MAAINVEHAKPAPPPITEVVLTLTEEEAVALGAVLGTTPAKAPFYGLYTTLNDAGFGYDHPAAADLRRRARREH